MTATTPPPSSHVPAGPATRLPRLVARLPRLVDLGAWLLAFIWAAPLLYAVWTAFHPGAYATRFDLTAPLTLDNFRAAWEAAPFPRYMLNTVMLVTGTLAAQLVIGTLAAFAFARLRFPGRNLLFLGVLVQLTIMPDVLIVQNYATLEKLGLVDTITGIAIPYVSSAFGIFLLRQTFMTIPKELDDAARLEGCSLPGLLRRVYIPLAKPVYVAYGLVSISHHWNNFLWPLVVARSVETRPLTVGLAVFASTDQGIDWSIITAATLLSAAPLLIAFLIFQRAFVQSFMRAGIK